MLQVICIQARAQGLRQIHMSDLWSAAGGVGKRPADTPAAKLDCHAHTHDVNAHCACPGHRNGKRNRRRLGTEHPGAIYVFAANAECTTMHNLRLEWLQDCHTTARQTHKSKRLPLVLSPHAEPPSGERHPGKRTARTAERGAAGILAARDILFPRGCTFLRQRNHLRLRCQC